jgi:hypothetical protein
MMLLDPLDPRVREWLARAARWEAAALRVAVLDCEARAGEHEAAAASLSDGDATLAAEVERRAEKTRAQLTQATAALEMAGGPSTARPRDP